jgi:GT2 family glycosyltransferase
MAKTCIVTRVQNHRTIKDDIPKPTTALYSNLNEMLFEYSGEQARRLVQASQTTFDHDAINRQTITSEMALAAAQAEIAELKEELRLLRSSTIWRLTHPVRAFVTTARAWHGAVINRWGKARPADTMTDAHQYRAWMRESEAACRAALWPTQTGKYPKTIGVAVWATPGCRAAVQSLLLDYPSNCTILVLDQGADLPAILFDGKSIFHTIIPAEAQPSQAVAFALACLNSDMLCFLNAHDRLAPNALALVIETAAQFPTVDMLFSDEDWLDTNGQRANPFFKPDWDPELQRGRDLVGPFAFFRRELVQRAAAVTGPAWLYDLTNQVAAAAQPNCIHHIPAVLCHRSALPPDYVPAMRAAATTQLKRDGIEGRVEQHPKALGWNRIIYTLPDPAPLVSIIVPTRDRATLLQACVNGILDHTSYPNVELIIVDNDSIEPATLMLFDHLTADPRVQILRQPGTFNWSALNNLAVEHATGSLVVLLNNDIAMLHPDWLTVLVSHAIQPGVGAVGAKLLYPDGRVQHAGLTTDQSGIPRHLFRYLGTDAPGAFGLAGLTREVWGVTGACIALRRSVFLEMGGLNVKFPAAYNDVEFCLRLTAHGYRILWTPWSCLLHHEMATRPPDHTDERREQVRQELAWLRHEWGACMERDPFLNPNLQLIDEQPHFRGLTSAQLRN